MESLLSSTYPNNTLEDNQNQIILDLSCIESSSEKSEKKKIDISKASIKELSSIIVSDMISSVRKDLASIRINTSK
jgi:hypothetical protein